MLHTNVVLNMSPIPSSIYIESGVPATILRDGVVLGKTGTRVFGLTPSTHELHLVADGYRMKKLTFSVTPNRSYRHEVSLNKLQGDIKVSATIPLKYGSPAQPPKQGEIKFASAAWEPITLPSSLDGVAPGNYLLHLKVRGYETSTALVTVRDQATTSAGFELRPKPSKVTFLTNIGKPVDVCKNDQRIGGVGEHLELMPFVKHSLQFKAKGYRVKRIKVGPLKQPGAIYKKPIAITLVKD
jgi:hypothetical protein